ncbi:hypothetical protein EMIHUDRAFT_244357 [Emiliania huxleyi CCMP1516]|uniref:tRNA/rRNA methyltransferase SpoU type domain-containing protein n=2 Tax=Emiliania huxleyi TaxID=2903 RepID=A0A0D3J0X2_EMIH1|nr:hypothetical protein EMIHUDRAFT_244357 [Emiliania huxleyi CCMP1516]EOD17157.1 hypothetical protein EMIHUDRAFT_244357 [Emiliania huxleyi CCMP1516]|eukprot:XP_005769586.1 hypothetical protein EMIHUDRAFT_244357 [Emiliania huxleyi CCMP1516]
MAGLRLVLDRLEDSGNRAAVLRSCEAFGLLHVHEIVGLRPSQQPRVAQKVAAAAKHGGNRRMRRGVGNGGEKWLCVHRHETAAACAEALRGAGFRIVATVPPPEGDRSDSWHDARAAADAAIVGERNEALAQLATAKLEAPFSGSAATIPLFGLTESLNVSALVAHYGRLARTRALRERAGGGEALLNVSEGDLTEAEVEALAADYSSRGKRFLEEDPWGEGAQAAAGAGVGAGGW